MPYDQVMHKFKEGTLHSGSKKGPKVKNRKQAIAIMLSEKRKGVKDTPHGSGPFTASEQKQGYKVCYTASELHDMNPDRMHNLEEFTLANRRNGNSRDKKVLRRLG